MSSWRRRSSAASSASRATCSAPIWRKAISRPDSSSSSAANSGHSSAEAMPSASGLSSPQLASPTGASIPAATPEAPAPGRSRSSTRTLRPRSEALHAIASPTMPAPTTSRSSSPPRRGGKATRAPPSLFESMLSAAEFKFLGGCGGHQSLRRHYPDQVLTVGGRAAALSARGPTRAPVEVPSYCERSRYWPREHEDEGRHRDPYGHVPRKGPGGSQAAHASGPGP